jgi:hypothetical protein
MAIYTNKKEDGAQLKSEFLNTIKKANVLKIATGYIGASLLEEIKPALIKVARKGECKLLIGMIYHEGVTASQKRILEELHDELKLQNANSGVFISRNEYHGKIYFCENEQEEFLFIGSSNLSIYGFQKRLECTALIKDKDTVIQTKDYLDFLFNKNTTNELSSIALKVKGSKKVSLKPSSLLQDYEVTKDVFDSLGKVISQQNIELRVDEQPNSSLNLYFDKGRKNQQGLYSPRPWYEVELTTSAQDRSDTNYPISTSNSSASNSRTGEFIVFISEGGKYFKIQMKVHSDRGKNLSSARVSGGRATLGRFIKGKLEEAGVLKEGERITSETLELYGRNSITLKKINDTDYILEF